MANPRINIDLDRIEHNADVLVDACGAPPPAESTSCFAATAANMP